jgi:hypothetical protein
MVEDHNVVVSKAMVEETVLSYPMLPNPYFLFLLLPADEWKADLVYGPTDVPHTPFLHNTYIIRNMEAYTSPKPVILGLVIFLKKAFSLHQIKKRNLQHIIANIHAVQLGVHTISSLCLQTLLTLLLCDVRSDCRNACFLDVICIMRSVEEGYQEA